jgi:hypothetical protein
MVDKTTPSESLLVHVARIIVFAIIIFVAVLAVDAFVLWLLNLVWNTDLWIILMWWEGIAMAFLGSAVWQYVHVYVPPWALPKPISTKLYRIKLKVQHPSFWLSVAMAGLMLILVGFLIWQFI